MNEGAARRLVQDADDASREERALRLSEAARHPNWDRPKLFVGEGARLLFEDVKATWIYGYFTSTILSSAGFCQLQVTGATRLIDVEATRGTGDALDRLRTVVALGLIDQEQQARLIEL